MIYLEPVDFISIDNVIENIAYYKDKFIKDSVICFRNANLSKEEQSEFNLRIGNEFGWYQGFYYRGEKVDDYVENHHHNHRINSAGPDDIMLSWHVEHPYYKNPIIAATWNMYNFKTDPNNGKTYFVDMTLVYDMLTNNEKDILSKAVISYKPEHHELFGKDPNINTSGHPLIRPHWITGKPTIRFKFSAKDNIILDSLDGAEPDQKTKDEFNLLLSKIMKMIAFDEDIRIVHRWQQGDLVMPDMFKLAHAVTGGFDPKDREFRGVWGWQYETI